jgi:hypothetical protein
MANPEDHGTYQEVSEVVPLRAGDLRSALAGVPAETPVVFDDGKQSWPIDQWGVFDDSFTLFSNESPYG